MPPGLEKEYRAWRRRRRLQDVGYALSTAWFLTYFAAGCLLLFMTARESLRRTRLTEIGPPFQGGAPIITAAEAARKKKVADMTVYRALERGELVGYRSGTTWLVDAASLEAWKPRLPGRPRSKQRRPGRAAALKTEP